ncbi:phospholipase D-like domain-containing protein [Antarctobacter heliothermus]|uniref:Phosphatidylserine/phosphatidylglycerophosphate/cardiolipin synthase n=1 Tax=Antarctobacter heliothermus TaxID=74033 RepID=A0A239C2M1_9RHOB|nr:phospholipase D-like domain-containing protein [Antarctobacter heliothermus]SNS13881.1 Phosphatidylserine/phosphatidylglycerophosphate/cardiolipin synthase [Antarctobacter heliothermus]
MTTRALLSANDAAAALERLVANATEELLLCLPQLSPTAPLFTPELRDGGLETWSDLLALLSRRGIDLRILIADTDPLLAPDRHRSAWSHASGFADVLQGEAQLVCATHGQRATGLRARALRHRIAPALATLRAEVPASLTPVQRTLLTAGAIPHPADILQSFAIADGLRAVIGGPDLGTDGPAVLALAVEDADFCGALRGQFADTWADARTSGAPSLAARLSPITCHARPQSREDLRLFRTLARPQRGLGPRPLADDIEAALSRLFRSARRHVLIRTAAFRHDGLAQALAGAATPNGPDVTLLLPPATRDTWDDARASALQATVLRELQTAYGPRLTLRADPTACESATLCLIDDVTFLGSATLTRRACRWNTEAMVLVRDPDLTLALHAHVSDTLARGETLETPAPRHIRSWLPDDLF